MASAKLQRFLIEQYVPRLDEVAARALAARLEGVFVDLRAQGVQIQWVHGVALPEEENLMYFIDAESIGHAVQASRCAGGSTAHVQKVITLEPEAWGGSLEVWGFPRCDTEGTG